MHEVFFSYNNSILSHAINYYLVNVIALEQLLNYCRRQHFTSKHATINEKHRIEHCSLNLKNAEYFDYAYDQAIVDFYQLNLTLISLRCVHILSLTLHKQKH